MSKSHCTQLARTGCTLGLLAIVLLVGACGAAPVTQGDAARGQSTWTQSPCMGCHGVNAQGSRLGPALAGTPLSLHSVTGVVRRGGPGMPKYRASQVSDQDLQDLYAWFQNVVPVATGGPGQNPWAQSPCAGCHGVNAEGGTGPALAGTTQPFTNFSSVVRQGARNMPALSRSEMSDQTLQAIYAWLQGQAQVPSTPQNLWAQVGCASCHGANAQGGRARPLAGEDRSFEEFQRAVRSGREGMPAYSTAEISDTDLQSLYNWLMTLR